MWLTNHIVGNIEYGVDNAHGFAYRRELGTSGPVNELTGPAAFDQACRDLASLDQNSRRQVCGVFNIKEAQFDYVLNDPHAQPPRRAHPSDAGYDLVIIDIAKKTRPEGRWGSTSTWWGRILSYVCSCLPGEVVLYETGVAVQPPHGYYFELVPRSSIVKSGYMLANSLGVIDASYQGTIKVPLVKWCWWARDLELPARVVQLVLRKQHYIDGREVPAFHAETVRGVGGFGSTGDGTVATIKPTE